MSNIGAGEYRTAYLIKQTVITVVDSQIKSEAPVETILNIDGVQGFRYRYLTEREMTFQPITAYMKGKFDKVIFSSETEITFDERNYILFDDGNKLRITRVLPQTQHGAFLISRNAPHIIELE